MTSHAGNTFAKGQRIDRYEIREPIGQGGMGAVYRAYDTKLGRTVALKTVVAHRRAGMNEELRQRFMREALAASKVDHRNVVQVLDFGFTDDGTPFIVMEYLRGKDLGARIKESAEPLAVEVVVDIMLGVCAALRACHQAGIIHRDLKPANIFLVDTDTGSEVKVLDFGVSKAPVAGDLTEEGQILGTPQYLSPEQIEGKTVPESDQYALGVLLYVCLTQRLPFEDHQSLSLLRAIELGKFQPPRTHRDDLPAGLEAIVLQALRLSPGDRFPSVHALGQRLWEFASPRGRDQWRNFYMETPPVARPAKESTLGIAILEELARGTLKGPAPLVPAQALASTEALKNTENLGNPPPSGKAPALPSRPGPQAFVSTKLARPPSPAPNDGSLMDVTGESAQPSSLNIERGRGLRRTIVGLLAGAGLVGGALFLYAGLGRGRRATVKEAAPIAAPAPLLPAIEPAPPPLPSRPVPVAADRPPPPTVDKPTPAAVDKPSPATVDKPAPAAVDKPAAVAATKAAAPGSGGGKRTRRRAHGEKSGPPLESTPEGVPIMP